MSKQLFFFVSLTFLFGACNGHKSTKVLARSHRVHPVDSLLNLMTIDEKIGQMSIFTSGGDVTGATLRESYKEDIRKGKIGAVFSAHTVGFTRQLQTLAMENSRLGIPLLFGYDVIHGYKTIFPIPLGGAASWDLAAIQQASRIAAIESSAAGLHWTFAPMIDIARDPRWGRVSEGAGEDTYYSSLVAQASVKGFQGTDLKKNSTILACAKHFAAYGAAQAGRDYNTVDISERTLREVYLPPFQSTVQAGVRTFMTAFNELNGIPATGNAYLLKDILRKEWGFDGMVVTDYTSINELVHHGVVTNDKEAGELALNAGVDMDMQGAVFYDYLKKSLKEGKVSMHQINQAARRILLMKYELGLFEDPYKYCNKAREKKYVFAKAHRKFARELAQKSIVLLKNEQNILPLSLNEKKSVAAIGPLADSHKDMLGAWSAAGQAEDCLTLKQGLLQAGSAIDFTFAKGCATYGEDQSGFAEAEKIASKSDIIILSLGESRGMSGEAASRANIGLPGQQLELAKRCKALGKPIIVILSNGRPLAIPWLEKNADAIVETWFLGTEAGNAIADVLFGKYNPSGRLPVTFPRNVGQIPIFYNMKNTGRPYDAKNKFTSKYLDVPNSPLYPFGFGLSYTSFKYGKIMLNQPFVTAEKPLEISIMIENTGQHDGTETVQLYIRDLVASVTRPVKELKGFQQVFLKKGARKELYFHLAEKDLRFYDKEMNWVTEPGQFEIFIGTNAETTRKQVFTFR